MDGDRMMTKQKFQIICFILFIVVYLAGVNLWLVFTGSTSSFIYVPGTFIIGLAGYWIGGYVYTDFINR